MTISEVPAQSGYVPVNNLQMYYEIHGTGQPLVLLHGAFSAIGTSFGQLLPGPRPGRSSRSSCRPTAAQRTLIAR